MSPRQQSFSTILDLQQRIDQHSQAYVSTGSCNHLVEYYLLVNQVKQIKQAVKDWEQIHGWQD